MATARSQDTKIAPPTTTPSPGRCAQHACVLEVSARKPGNVHRCADLPGLTFADFVASARAIAEPMDRALQIGVGRAILDAIEATRQVVNTNTNLGMVLLLAPLAAVPELVDLADGVARVITATTVDDAQHVYRAIRLAQPGGLGTVPEQDVTEAPTITLRDAMAMAADRDSVARQYANGYQEVFHEALPALRQALAAGRDVETAIVATHLRLMANHPDSLIARKYGQVRAAEVSARAAEILGAGWPDCVAPWDQIDVFDTWLRHPAHRFNPGTTADLVTAALYVAIRDGTILGTSISTQGVALG